MKGRTLVLPLLALLAMTARATGQELSALQLEIERLARAEAADRPDLIVELRDNLWKAVYLAPGQSQVADILALRRADVQAGAGSGASGSTSAVSSPLLPAMFGVAIENGALTRTVSGTTITLKAVPAQILCASVPGAAAAVARRDDDACRTFWRRVGVTAAFDTTRGEKKAQLDNLETLTSQFADLSVRVELINRRKATGTAYVGLFQRSFDAWKGAATAFAAVDRRTPAVLEAENSLGVALEALVAGPSWVSTPVEQRRRAIETAIRSAVAGIVLPDATAREVREAWLTALRADEALQNAIANAPVLTAEYGLQQPDLVTTAIGTVVPAGTRPPRLHSGRVIYARGWGERRLDLTANASLSWFDDVRPGMRGRFRDVRVGGEAKFKLRELPNYGTPTVSFAALYSYLHQEPLGLGLVAFNLAQIEERGHLGLFQTKLEFPTARNSIRIPLSFSYSNRTELIRESEVRGQLGISFNLDALFAAPG